MWGALRGLSVRAFRDDAINDLRAELGQEPVRGNAGWAWLEADRTVVLTSRHYFGDAPTDWPDVVWGGFSPWDGPPSSGITDELAAFLAEGDRPVLVTLGTSAASGAGDVFTRIGRDLDAAGLRSVMLVGSDANLAAVAGRPGAVRFAPMTAVLPHCQVAVISGALGGLAASLRAGVPVVIHPQLFDQVWHGGQVERLGVGIMARKPSQVAAAIRAIAADPAYARRAQALAAQMASEDGAGVMVQAVEDVFGPPFRLGPIAWPGPVPNR